VRPQVRQAEGDSVALAAVVGEAELRQPGHRGRKAAVRPGLNVRTRSRSMPVSAVIGLPIRARPRTRFGRQSSCRRATGGRMRGAASDRPFWAAYRLTAAGAVRGWSRSPCVREVW
jgi:hypothetical protein